jgi:hypothetical protein
LGLVLLTCRIERLDVDLFPRTAVAIPGKIAVVVMPGLAGALFRRPRILQRGKRLGRPAGGQQTAADLGAYLRPAAVLHGHQRDVAIDVGLAICDIL